jgi:hypothetical protein
MENVEEIPRKTDFPRRSLCAEFSWKMFRKFRGKQIFQGNHCERIFMKNVYKICTAEKKTLHFPPNKLRKIHRGIDYSYLLNFYGLKHVTQIILIAYITKIAILCKIIHPSRLPILVLLLCPHVTARQECLSAEIMNVTSNDVSGKKNFICVRVKTVLCFFSWSPICRTSKCWNLNFRLQNLNIEFPLP